MALVVDASVAFKWFVPEMASAAALALLDRPSGLIAPDLVVVEVVNALWARLRGREGFAQAVTDAAAALPRMFDMLPSAAECVPRALELTVALNHPLYDCVYLALAEREHAQLITADLSFFRKVHDSPLAPLIVALEASGG